MEKKQNVTLSLNLNLYKKYSDMCKREGLVVSRQIEKFIEKQLVGEKNE